jgi:hypothetical protein
LAPSSRMKWIAICRGGESPGYIRTPATADLFPATTHHSWAPRSERSGAGQAVQAKAHAP